MGVRHSKKKGGTSLIITVVLLVIVFAVSIKFLDQIEARFEFLMFFVLGLLLLSFIIRGKNRRISLAVFPIVVGICYVLFIESHGEVTLSQAFVSMSTWINIAAVLLASLIYLIKVGHKKNILWDGKDDGTHEKEVIEMAHEKNKKREELSKLESDESDIEPEEKEAEEKVEIKDKVEELDEAPAFTGYGSALNKPEEEESYFNLDNENDLKKDPLIEKDLNEEVGDILDDLDNDDDLEEKKEDLSEGMSVNFDRAVNEDDY